MGRVFKPYYTKKIPPTATVVTHDGLLGVWLEVDGSPRFAVVGAKPGTVCVTVSEWYIEYTDASGKQRRNKVSADYAEAERALERAESKAKLQRSSMNAMGVNTDALIAQVGSARPARPLRDVEGMFHLDLTLFPFLSAVYFLSHQGEVVYVGQSVNFLRRIIKHMEDKTFDAVSYLPTPSDQLEATEAAYIRHFKPKYNLDDQGIVRLGWRKRRERANKHKGAKSSQACASEGDSAAGQNCETL